MSISMKRYNDTIITPKDDRILFDQIFDDYGLIYGGSATMAASNKIHVGAARGFIKGTEVIVEAEDIAVNLSDSGTKNGRLKIVMDLADTETPIKFESEVAASFPALEQDANINYDNGRYEVVFATYKATETTISSVALVMPTMQSVKAKIQGINQSLTQLKNKKMVTDVLITVEGMTAKTDKTLTVPNLTQYDYILIATDVIKGYFRFGNFFLPAEIFLTLKEFGLQCHPKITHIVNIQVITDTSLRFYANSENQQPVYVRVYGIKNQA